MKSEPPVYGKQPSKSENLEVIGWWLTVNGAKVSYFDTEEEVDEEIRIESMLPRSSQSKLMHEMASRISHMERCLKLSSELLDANIDCVCADTDASNQKDARFWLHNGLNQAMERKPQ